MCLVIYPFFRNFLYKEFQMYKKIYDKAQKIIIE